MLGLVIYAAAFVSGASAAASGDSGVIGVTVPSPAESLLPQHWDALRDVSAEPEFLYLPKNMSADDPRSPFDFSLLLKELDVYAAHGFERLAVTLTPHLANVPIQPQKDEKCQDWSQRQNPFDPAFVEEWGRMLREFAAGPLQDDRIARVYVAPPSYYGEVEYYMGEDWSNLRLLAYDGDARARLVEWLVKRYATPEAVAKAWGRPIAKWDAIQPSLPPTSQEAILAGKANDWLDFVEWRTEYLTSLVAEPLKAVASRTDKDVGFKVAWGDMTAFHATDTAAILAQCAGLKNLVLHQTNGHSAMDSAYVAALGRRYGLRRLITENDGARYGRTEIAKIVLNCFLAGIDNYNFSYLGHMVDTASAPTESSRALASARQALLRSRPQRPPAHPIAFLHSNTTRAFRPPKFFCKDVALVYDGMLNNERPYHWWCYSWSRSLAMPDVTGEQLVRDGDLEGRRVVIVPNTMVTVLPTPVRAALMKWVEAGGMLIGFGNESLAWELEPASPAAGAERCRRVPDWPDIASTVADTVPTPTPTGDEVFGSRPWARPEHPLPVWASPLPAPWQAMLADKQGRPALACRAVGRGRIVLFPQPVPALGGPQESPTYRRDVPLMLRALAESQGCKLAFQTFDDIDGRPSTSLCIKYLGKEMSKGTHVFCGGAYDHSTARLRFEGAKGLTGKARLILVDLPFVTAAYATGTGTPVINSNYPPNGQVYIDPTNTERDAQCLIPITEVEFDVERPIILGLRPN